MAQQEQYTAMPGHQLSQQLQSAWNEIKSDIEPNKVQQHEPLFNEVFNRVSSTQSSTARPN